MKSPIGLEKAALYVDSETFPAQILAVLSVIRMRLKEWYFSC
jgi:hypothetical protein